MDKNVACYSHHRPDQSSVLSTGGFTSIDWKTQLRQPCQKRQVHVNDLTGKSAGLALLQDVRFLLYFPAPLVAVFIGE
jgi:hypothetical protein